MSELAGFRKWQPKHETETYLQAQRNNAPTDSFIVHNEIQAKIFIEKVDTGLKALETTMGEKTHSKPVIPSASFFSPSFFFLCCCCGAAKRNQVNANEMSWQY